MGLITTLKSALSNMTRPIKIISEDEYREMDDNYQGICIACGEIADECEPDACNYPCEACGRKKVFGVEEALSAGYIDIADDESEEYEIDDDESDEESTDSN